MASVGGALLWACATVDPFLLGKASYAGAEPREGWTTEGKLMTTTVIVAEKPSVGREIAGVVDASLKKDGYLETRDGATKVTWAFGHLVRYAEPKGYGEAWSGKWSFAQLPMIPDDWLLMVRGEAAKQFQTVKQLINGATRVVCATDAGREGEHIFRLIYKHAGCKAPVERLWVSSLTPDALRAGLANLQPGRALDSLARAAEARAKADWLVGMNLTRAFSVRHDTLLSVGRVQTPTLALVVQRDRAVQDFRAKPYWEVFARVEPGFDAVYAYKVEADETGKVSWARRLEQYGNAEDIVQGTRNRPAVVERVETKRVRHRPPSLYDLTSLQQDANKRFGWSAAKTLEAAQALYEAKLITYPRTESRHLPEDMRPLLEDLLKALSHPRAELALDYLRRGRGKVPGKAYIDSAKLTDHHAIIPTREAFPGSLSKDRPITGGPASKADGTLGQLYSLVVSRFVQIFFTDQVVDETAVRLDIGGRTFLANGRREVEPGWRVVEPSGQANGAEDKDPELPALKKGDSVTVTGIEAVEKETTPPQRYSDASLLSAVKNAGRQVEDAGKAEILKESGGLGTPATRAGMIEALLKRGYLVRKGKTLLSTDRGRALIAAAVEPLSSPELTATWEQQLSEIEDGKGSAEGFLDAIATFVRDLLPKVQGSSAKVPPRRSGKTKAVGSCPVCGQDVVETAKAFGCSAWRDTGCAFKVWKVIAGKKLGATHAKALLSKGRTRKLKGFRSRAGKAFEAALKLNEANEAVLDFGKN